MRRRKNFLLGLLVIVILIGILAFVRLQRWGTFYWRPGFLQPNTQGWIACINRIGDQGDLVMIRPDGAQTAIESGPSDEEAFGWSPNGATLVFSSNRRGEVYQLFLVDADNRFLRPVTLGGGPKKMPSYTPEGDHILFLQQGQVAQVDPRGEHIERILPHSSAFESPSGVETDESIYRYARLAPTDERLLAAVQEADFGEVGVWYFHDHTQHNTQFTKAIPVIPNSRSKRSDVDWSRDQLKLVFAGAVTEIFNPETEEFVAIGSGLLLVDFTGAFDDPANPKQPKITPLWGSPDNSEAAIQPVWQPNNERIAYVRCTVAKDGSLKRVGLMVIPVLGGEPTEIVSGEVYDPQWSPDSKRLVYTKGAVGDRQVYVVELETGAEKQLTSDGDYVMPQWSPKQ